MYKYIVVNLVALIFISGCAVGVKHDYVQDTLNIDAATDREVVVATLDHRAYIFDRRKNENFVGLSRGGFGNPFDVVTQSGNPLALDISSSVALSLVKRGVDARVIELEASQSQTDARKILSADGAYRTLLFTLREWKGDSMMSVRFLYDFDLNLYDENGGLLFKKHMLKDEVLGSSDPFNPGGGELITVRFRSLMEWVFDDPELQQYLK